MAGGGQPKPGSSPLPSAPSSTIHITRKCWHMLLNLCFHMAMTSAVFAGGITLTGYLVVCQAVGATAATGGTPDGAFLQAEQLSFTWLHHPCADHITSSRRSASFCTTPPCPRCCGWW